MTMAGILPLDPLTRALTQKTHKNPIPMGKTRIGLAGLVELVNMTPLTRIACVGRVCRCEAHERTGLPPPAPAVQGAQGHRRPRTLRLDRRQHPPLLEHPSRLGRPQAPRSAVGAV